MILGVSEDFSCDVVLDAELNEASSSGLNLNSGTHPSITLNNLLAFLPFYDITIAEWDLDKTYSKYSVSQKRTDLVMVNDVIYQSLQVGNLSKDPETETAYWLQTNIESLTLKAFISRVQNKVYADLNLTKRLVNNQFIYEVGKYDFPLPNDFAAWIFEPKGSDYLSFTINQIALQANTTDDVNLYVLNETSNSCVLIDTLILKPNNGLFEFKELKYKFSGKGRWIFAIESQSIKSNQGVVDPLLYDGFVCYTATGIGLTPESAQWSDQTTGNGIGFNISVSLDSQLYIDNNIDNLANFVRSTFELMSLQMFLHNSGNRSNRSETIQSERELLIAETKVLDANTIAKKYTDEKKEAKKLIDKTFDTQLSNDNEDSFNIELSST